MSTCEWLREDFIIFSQPLCACHVSHLITFPFSPPDTSLFYFFLFFSFSLLPCFSRTPSSLLPLSSSLLSFFFHAHVQHTHLLSPSPFFSSSFLSHRESVRTHYEPCRPHLTWSSSLPSQLLIFLGIWEPRR
jgi:hypothetical protein